MSLFRDTIGKSLVCRNNLPYKLLSEEFAFIYDDIGSTKRVYVKRFLVGKEVLCVTVKLL